jgi:hypothetical protein
VVGEGKDVKALLDHFRHEALGAVGAVRKPRVSVEVDTSRWHCPMLRARLVS